MSDIQSTPWQIEQQFRDEAKQLSPEQLSDFLQKATLAYQGAFFPVKLTQELLHNPKLPLEVLASSQTSPALYKSILQHLGAIAAPIDATHTTKDIAQLFTLLVNDPLFPTVDDSLFKMFARTVAEKSPLAQLSSIRIRILDLCTPARFSLLNTAFIESSYQDFLPEEIAQHILTNLIQTHTYPFLDKYRFFLHVLERVGQNMFHTFLLGHFSSFIPSTFQREELLLAIAEGPFYDFPVFYFKNEYRLTTNLNRRHSPQLKRTKIICYQKLTFIQKMLSAIPILL